MENFAQLELYLDGAWRQAARVSLRDPMERGWEAGAGSDYDIAYAVEHDGRRDAAALGVGVPVSLDGMRWKTWPPFLIDLLPQGYGRQELLKRMGLPETAGASADWPLLLAGAGNPIGNLRVRQAAAALMEHAPADRQGFTWDDVVSREEGFIEYLARHGLFVAGSSGVQGEWPKILLAEGRDGRYYLDHALPDDAVFRHWLVKFSRGGNRALATILRLEAPYMALARHLGLRVHGEFRVADRALFIPRFDREVENGKVKRHAQESMASLCGLAGFGLAPSHNEGCRQLARVCTDRESDIVEYVKRDVANVALGNKDNHGRNTAIQRRENGFIGLTPLYDFAPMMLHPDGIARRMRWERDDGGSPRWGSVVLQVSEATGLDRGYLIDALRSMLEPLRSLEETALSLGVDAAVMNMQRAAIGNIVSQIEAM